MTRVILTIVFGFMILASFSVQAKGRGGYHDNHYRPHHCKHKRHHNKHHGYHQYRHAGRRYNGHYRHDGYARLYRAPYPEAGAYFEYTNDGVILVYQSYPQRLRGY